VKCESTFFAAIKDNVQNFAGWAFRSLSLMLPGRPSHGHKLHVPLAMRYGSFIKCVMSNDPDGTSG